MYELIQITEHDYYIDCPARMGLVRVDDDKVVLIDSGNDKDAGKKALRLLEANRWQLQAIYNTHAHADHIGGNQYLQQKTGCAIYARGMECVYTNNPALEPITLFGGLPFKALRHKFLQAKESQALPLNEECLPANIKLLELPGHTFDMVGFITSEGTAYIGDCVASAETLAKYGISYLWDVETTLATLAYIKTVPASHFVPAHAPVCTDISELAETNVRAIQAVKAKLLELCKQPTTFEELLKAILDEYGMQLSALQYAMVGSTLRSYLSSMYDNGALKVCFRDNRLLWETVKEA